MRLNFTKMHGLGNDFVVLDGIRQTLSLTPDHIRKIADRRFGIGCDQVLVVERAQNAGVDFRYRIYNSDGGEVENCGNGARCFAHCVRAKGLTAKTEIAVEILSGVIHPRIEDDGQVTVDMGVPRLQPSEVPFEADSRQDIYTLELNVGSVQVYVLSMGNPHAVQIVDNVDNAPVSIQGPLIEHHRRFPRRVNAGYMQILDPGHIRLRVYERGAGETLACGTGACAAVVCGIQLGLLDAIVKVHTRGGELTIQWSGGDASVMMTGPATSVFSGEIDIPDNL